jgi:cyclophilin family peptidyl-prolyl cis-trans isomerase
VTEGMDVVDKIAAVETGRKRNSTMYRSTRSS